MTEVIGVRFKQVGKIYYFSPNGVQMPVGEKVIVETARGIECGEVALSNREIEDEGIVKPLKTVIRVANKEDLKRIEDNKAKEKKAFRLCLEKIEKHKLEMKLVDVEYTFDNNKILFYFTADGRVDFRELVKDLASESSCAKSVCAMKQRCWADWESAADRFAAAPFWESSSRCPSKWQRSRDCHSTRPKFREPAAG